MTEPHENTPDEKNVEGVAAKVAAPDEAGASLWSDAWRIMRSRPLFWMSAGLIALFVLMAAVPQLFTNADPSFCDLSLARLPPDSTAWFGYDLQGCDVYSRTIYGARSSILVGVMTVIATVTLGVTLGIVAGYAGGWVDALLSRIADVFFAIPLLLGGIIIMYTFRSPPGSSYWLIVGKVVFAMAILYWPNIFRLMRSSVLQVKPNEYVLAAKALGASPARIILSHIMPNAIAPVIVVATIDLGAFITTEAALSFLGIGLQPPVISWGIAISEASGLGYIAAAPHMLLFPSLFLSLAVLGFIMLGEVVRDAMDPKLR
ncbi:MAG: ABC transporter permease [Arachnia sp.]